MATTGLGIAPDSEGNGLTPLAHRMVIGSQWESDGVITGLAVKGRNDLRYQVAPGVAVMGHGFDDGTDGMVIAFYEGGLTPEVPPGDPANPRIDSVWVKARDLEMGDPDNKVHVFVESGQPAASPVAPQLPEVGGVVIRNMLVPAGTVATSSCTTSGNLPQAVPYGGSAGLLASAVNTYAGPGDKNDGGKDYFEQACSFETRTCRLVEFVMYGTICAARPDGSKPAEDSSALGAYFQCVQLDGKDVEGGGVQVPLQRPWTNFRHSVVVEVEPGRHTARVRQHRKTWGAMPYFISGTYATDGVSETYPPRTLEVWDRGVTS